MHGIAAEKVPDGKLLRVKVDYSDLIERVQLTGDFFVHPEDDVLRIEEAIAGMRADEDEETITDVVRTIVTENRIELIGISPEAIARNVRRAIESR
ncbi:MAG: hypothetical protein HYY37_05410 [Candidatus Aenigmarchaeota archaeon]|nr:hypothetical protein [Candidatus Aenigmarchaeota archaeon]